MAKRTKIVCTLGPSVDSESTLKGLITAGMDIARFNFSHGSHEEHLARMERLRKVRRELDSPCAMLLDTKGPEIRTGMLADHKPVQLMAGRHFTFTEREVEGTDRIVSQTCHGLAEAVEPGTIILVDDGLIELAVDVVEGFDIHCTVQNSGMLGERKSINLPSVSVPLPVMTDQDRSDLLFGIEQEVDFVAASFIRNAEGVREMREFLDVNGGGDISFISKIECSEAVENIDEIIEASDGVMIARGDLGVEVPAHKVPHIQKEIIRKCNRASKPVITATQMLDSMIRNPRPTRAEVGDVANAIYDGTDAVMLSGETACGRYPIPAVQMMARIAEASEPFMFEESMPDRTRVRARVALAVGIAAVQTAENVNATCIVAPTMSGRTSRLVSNLRPRVPIYAVTPFERVMRKQQIHWGVTPMLGDVQGDMIKVVDNARRAVVSHGLVHEGDIAVITAGDRSTSPVVTGAEEGPAAVAATNVMYVVQIRDADQANKG
ncbi:pyruvate kinase [uncultured Ellagibacter sp.]|uniref:pyruvate kinase n=1 Tax=uncultured Ellagibacter sp. TaxID=2137580 RepID=UPI002622FC12|nr:pyruvate kinase [uncultured Ellagibacter sp.]